MLDEISAIVGEDVACELLKRIRHKRSPLHNEEGYVAVRTSPNKEPGDHEAESVRRRESFVTFIHFQLIRALIAYISTESKNRHRSIYFQNL